MVKVEDLSLVYKDNIILNKVSCDINNGLITCFMGESGAGKTSLFKCIAQLITNYTGTILINGKDAKILKPYERAKSLGFVFQHFNLFPHLTVLRNCTEPLMNILSFDKAKAQGIAFQWLNKLGMEQHSSSYPAELSGGQQQRVALARALCLNADTLLLDEPMASLDQHNRMALKDILLDLKQGGTTIALTLHDKVIAKELVDTCYVVDKGTIAVYHLE